MALRRVGSPTSLWNNVAVGVGGVSNPVLLPREGAQVCVFISVSAATTVSLQVAHHGALTAEGNEANAGTPPDTNSFYTLYYIDTPIQVAFTVAGKAAIIVPDFEPGWIRLSSSAAATITAGHEITGD